MKTPSTCDLTETGLPLNANGAYSLDRLRRLDVNFSTESGTLVPSRLTCHARQAAFYPRNKQEAARGCNKNRDCLRDLWWSNDDCGTAGCSGRCELGRQMVAGHIATVFFEGKRCFATISKDEFTAFYSRIFWSGPLMLHHETPWGLGRTGTARIVIFGTRKLVYQAPTD